MNTEKIKIMWISGGLVTASVVIFMLFQNFSYSNGAGSASSGPNTQAFAEHLLTRTQTRIDGVCGCQIQVQDNALGTAGPQSQSSPSGANSPLQQMHDAVHTLRFVERSFMHLCSVAAQKQQVCSQVQTINLSSSPMPRVSLNASNHELTIASGRGPSPMLDRQIAKNLGINSNQGQQE